MHLLVAEGVFSFMALLHEPLLSIAIRILSRIQAIQQTWLFMSNWISDTGCVG